MIKYNYIILLISLLFSFGCGKKVTLKISAKNPVTEEPYPNLSFVVYRSTGISDAFGNKYKTVYSGDLNENGEAIIEIREKNNKGYYVSMKGPDDVCYRNHNEIAFSNPTIVGNHFNYEFVPCAHLKLIINNVNCEGEGDTLKYRGKTSISDWSGWSNKLGGCYFYEQPNFKDVNMGWWIYEWQVDRSGVVTTYKDSIYLNEGQQGVFEMLY